MIEFNYLDAIKTVERYQLIVSNINNLIKESGYRPSFFAESLNMTPNVFYNKRRTANFSTEEIFKIIKYLSDLDDLRTMKRMDEIEATERLATDEECEQWFEEIGV